jgi:IPT/TIG domain-containing protein
MLRFAPTSSAGRQGRSISWLLIAALLFSAFSSVLPSVVQPRLALAADRMIKMPFASGANWTISQGYNTNPNNGGSHYNCPDYPGVGCSPQWMYKYSFDLVRADGNTAGQPVLSPVNGTIRWIDVSYGGMSINLGNGWAVAYFHTDLAPGLAAGQSIVQGQWLGTIAQPGGGGNGGFPHIHVTLWKTTDGGNWSRDAQPFTGAQSLDGYDFPDLGTVNQYRGRTVTSTNTQIGGATIPKQVAKTTPAHNATVATTQVSLNWSAVSGATSYQVVLDPDTVNQQFSPWLSGTSWSTPALSNGAHKWKVQARNSAGVGAWSSLWTFYVSTGFADAELNNGAMIAPGKYRVFGTRQGMVGGTTSSGHVITPNDHFVSLPACVKTTCTWLTPGTTDATYGYVTDCGGKCYVIIENPKNGSCRVAAVLDRGPWFNVDDYWNPANQRFVNKEIARDGLGYHLAQGYPADAAAFAGTDVGWGTTTVAGVKRGNTNLKKNGVNYPVTFQTSIDIGDGTWLELGFPWDPGPQTVVVTMLWQVGTTLADAQAKCGTTEPPAPKPVISLSKSSGTPGTTVNVTGTGFGKNETVRVYLDSSKTTAIATTTSDSTGAISTSFTVPDTVGGPHRIHVVGRTSGLRTAKTFKIMPLATSSKASGSANLSLIMTGTNFAAGEVVNVYWDGSTTSAGRGTADSTGKVAISVRGPKVNGAHTAKLTGSTNNLSATATFKVVQRVRVTPTQGESGTTIKAYGTGWPAKVTVSFRWSSKTGTVLCSAITDTSGYAECTFRPPSSASAGTYAVWGTNGSLSASSPFTKLGAGAADNPTETPTETASPTPTPDTGTPVDGTPIDETPIASPTEAAPEQPTVTPVPTETPTVAPTEVPAPRTAEVVAVADTSVSLANPDQPQPAEVIAALQAGGPDSAVAYVSFNVADVGAGTVTEAYLVVTGTSGGGPGGTVAVVPGYLVDEAGTYNALPTQGLSAAVTANGSASTIGPVGPGEAVWVDVTGSVQADGQYTFVIVGDPAQILELSSREGGSPPKLVLTIQD